MSASPVSSLKIKSVRLGALAVVAGLLIASGLLRFGTEAGQALATGTEVASEDIVAPVAPSQSDAVLEAFREREERLELRETQLADRMQALRVAETMIATQLESLEAAEASLEATLALADRAAETDIGRLTAVYETMKPRDAAALFAEMETAFAAGFLARMRPDAAAAIMAGLDPARAYAISVMFAARHAGVPEE